MKDQEHTRSWATLAVAIGASIILLFAACGPNDGEQGGATETELASELANAAADPEDRYDASFVGRVEGTDALIGITPYEGRLLAYVCDGETGRLGRQEPEEIVAQWFDGPIRDGSFDLRSGEPAIRLAGEQTAIGFTGTVTMADGGVHAFTAVAAVAAAEEDEGLYSEWITSDREQGGIDIGRVRFDGITTGSAQPSSFGGTLPECRPTECTPLRPTSTLAPATCPPLPPRECI
ncbi:MAG: hypothetical protein ACRD0A_17255 [Acidimicrobiales bacterium]